MTESTKIIASGIKNGKQLTVTWEEGGFSSLNDKDLDHELFGIAVNTHTMGGTYHLSDDDPLKAEAVFDEFFDKRTNTVYNGDEPMLPSEEGAIY